MSTLLNPGEGSEESQTGSDWPGLLTIPLVSSNVIVMVTVIVTVTIGVVVVTVILILLSGCYEECVTESDI